MGRFHKQLAYKTKWYGSERGEVAEEVPLSKRTFICGSCGFEVDRDLNAAINLEKYVAVSSTETEKTPVLEESSGRDGNILVKLSSREKTTTQAGTGLTKLSSGKQEPDGKARERFA